MSSFAYLTKKVPVGGKIKIKGGQTDGYVAPSQTKISVDKYTPRLIKGVEYVAPYKAEEDKMYYENMMSKPDRGDVTSGEGVSQMQELEELTSVGTVPNVVALDREQSTRVYQFYSLEPVEPEDHLKPIHAEREKIVGLIESNSVVVIEGPTGCGKSTQIPQFILDSYAARKAHCNIVVTQPRRIAAITIGEHICKQRNWELGQLVGYQVALERKTSEDTRLLYCTTGVLLEKLIQTKNLNEYTHIILDEVHEREEDMDFVMLIVKRFLRSNSPNVRIVLMSATLNVSRFAQYFETITRTKRIPAPCHVIQLRKQFEVLVYYLDSLRSLGKLPHSFDKSSPNCDEELFKIIPYMIESFNRIDESDFKMKKSMEERAAVLIFLPGLYQIEALHEILSKADEASNRRLNLWLCPLHSSITKDEQEKVRRYAPEGRRKIILSTNIAESSITIPDVKYVIDFCLTKHLVADPDTGFSSLQLAWASHTNCIQREGRVGRVQEGRVYRLVYKDFYENYMDKECLPEMQRCPLESIVLKCKKLMKDSCPLELISSALDPPDFSNYEKTILKLKEIGALLTTCNSKLDPQDGDLTFVGLVMASLPLDIHITKLILLGYLFDILAETIIMGCAMSVRNIFSEPFQDRMDSYNNKLIWSNTNESDPIAYLNVYQSWRQQKGAGRFERNVTSEESWAKRFMVQLKHLKEVAKLEDDIKKRLRNLCIEPLANRHKVKWSDFERGLICKFVLAGAFYPHYFSRKPQSLSAEHDATKMLGGCSAFNSVFVQDLPEPHAIYKEELKKLMRKHKISDDVEIHTDGSKKVVIEFRDHSNTNTLKIDSGNGTLKDVIPGNIRMAVYRAVKMKQLRIPMIINCLHPRELEKELENYRLNQAVSSSRIDYKPAIPLNLSHFMLKIPYIQDAGRFYANIVRSEDTSLGTIHHILNQKNNGQVFQGKPAIDSVCAAPYMHGGRVSYYRGKVKGFSNPRQAGVGLMAKIFFIDYGNTEEVPVCILRTIDAKFENELNEIPPQAIECVLAEVGPSMWSNGGGEWSEAATRYVRNKIQDQELFAKVYSYVDKVASLYIYIYDNRFPSNQYPPSINDKLIEKEFAVHKVESYLSKENNRKRREIAIQGYDHTAAKDDDTVSIRSMSSGLSQLALSAPAGFRPRVCLKGPYSPLEMKLFSLTHCSTKKSVQIEGNSVNSVLLDSDPSDPHERLVVAASVSQSSDGNKLTLNHTTMLPNIKGLAAMVCLIFCPKAELRVDENFSRYTGALCGLGINPEDGSSMFPENDIEIPFDTELDSDDLLDINRMRHWMNQRLGTFQPEDTTEDDVIKIQKNLHILVLRLMKRARSSVRVTYSRSSHVWGRLDKKLLLLPYPDSEPAVDFKNDVYPLHYGVQVNPKNDREEVRRLYKELEELEEYMAHKVRLKEIKCSLCDANFEYEKLLGMHLDSFYHYQLRKWLLNRVKAHNLPKPAPVFTQHSPTSNCDK